MILGNKIIVSYFYGINPAQAENPISFKVATITGPCSALLAADPLLARDANPP